MPKGFYVLNRNELLWTPLKLDPNDPSKSRRIHWMWAFLRLPDGMSLAAGATEVNGIASRLKTQDPSGDAALRSATANRCPSSCLGDVRPALLLLMGSVGLVLLIACSNVVNLLLARGAGAARRTLRSQRAGCSAIPPDPSVADRSRYCFDVLPAPWDLASAHLRSNSCSRCTRPTSLASKKYTSIVPCCFSPSSFPLLVGVIFGLAPAFTSSRGQSQRGAERKHAHLQRDASANSARSSCSPRPRSPACC